MAKIILCITILSGFVVPATNCLASLPAPVLSYSTSGLNAAITWTAVPESTRYALYYAPYPYVGEETIGSIDRGSALSYSIDLWDGAAYYIAVTAFTGAEESEYSNVELLTIDTGITPVRHEDISVSVFWIGEQGGRSNGYISNVTSTLDDSFRYSCED